MVSGPKCHGLSPFQPCSHYSLVMLCFIMSSIPTLASYPVFPILLFLLFGPLNFGGFFENFLSSNHGTFVIFRCQLHRKPSIHDRGRQRCSSSAGVVPQKQRQLPLVPEPHQLPLTSHQKRSCKCFTFSISLQKTQYVVVIVANLPVSLQRTVCDRARSRSSPCWNLVSDKLSSTTSPQSPKEWRRTWTSLALPQMSETLISEWIAIHLVCDESLRLCFCWVWALAKGFMGQMENGLTPAPHHLTNTSTTCPSARPNCWLLSSIPCGFDHWAIAGQDHQWRTGNEWKSQFCLSAPLYVLSQK